MFRILFIFYFGIIIHIVHTIPVDKDDEFDKITFEIEESLKNITNVYDDIEECNSIKNRVGSIIDNIKKKGAGGISSIKQLTRSLSDVAKNVKNIGKSKAYIVYARLIENIAVHVENADAELTNLFDDIKPHLKSIKSTIKGTYNVIADNVDDILHSVVSRVDITPKSLLSAAHLLSENAVPSADSEKVIIQRDSDRPYIAISQKPYNYWQPNSVASDFSVTSTNLISPVGSIFGSNYKRQRGEKKPIPEEQKDDKYFERRRRNNQAAKKSRDARKLREDQVALKAAILEHENAILRAQVLTLRDEVTTLRRLLMEKKISEL
ncbi:hypothetical protein FQR65_LT01099 [Abscondita terminalis]|nr:hypothetical protein FQR65_LT01099 [Abscondita terminalis]